MFLQFFLFNKLQATSYKLQAIQGFSLIEMLVVLTIFIIMLAVVLANFPAFRDQTALQLIAQEIATTIRQAQVYGIGTRAAGTEFPAHGIYFDVSLGADKKSFILFADSDKDNQYTAGNSCPPGTECVEKFVIRGGAEIDEIKSCGTNGCGPPSFPIYTSYTILFQRFYPEAKFFDSGTEISGVSYVRIVVKSTRDPSSAKWIDVWNTGQITVKNPS